MDTRTALIRLKTRAGRRGRRVWNRWKSLARSPRAVLVYNLAYRGADNDFSDPLRAQKIFSYLLEQGLVSARHWRRAPKATLGQLALVHPYSYLERLEDPDVVTLVFGEVAPRDVHTIIEQQRWMTGGTLRAAEVALEGRTTVVNLGGGFHHAQADRGEGFCLFNDVAVATACLRANGFEGRILVIDLDLHQGNGTRRIFAEDPRVFTFSLHATDWDEDPAGSEDLNVALGNGIGDGAFREGLARTLPQALERSRPDLVFYVAGVDGAIDDKIGSWRLSAEAILDRDQQVIAALAGLPTVWTLAGGYGTDAWRYTARSLSWLLGGSEAPIPTSMDQALTQFRRIAGRFNQVELTTDLEDDWSFTTEEILGEFGHPEKPKKVLGFYSQHGLEIALERYGVLPHLRSLGFTSFQVTIDTSQPTGDMARLWGDAGELLIEIVLRETEWRERRFLFVEWLLLQNPRRFPASDRPLLPGQEHPGLGCLGMVVMMLVMSCERLGLDGIAFRPAHFHVAAQSKGHLTFVDPVDEARFLALEAALAGIPLAEATRLVADGAVIDEHDGEPVSWEPDLMVVPVSDTLRAWMAGEEFARAVEESVDAFDLVVREGVR